MSKGLEQMIAQQQRSLVLTGVGVQFHTKGDTVTTSVCVDESRVRTNTNIKIICPELDSKTMKLDVTGLWGFCIEKDNIIKPEHLFDEYKETRYNIFLYISASLVESGEFDRLLDSGIYFESKRYGTQEPYDFKDYREELGYKIVTLSGIVFECSEHKERYKYNTNLRVPLYCNIGFDVAEQNHKDISTLDEWNKKRMRDRLYVMGIFRRKMSALKLKVSRFDRVAKVEHIKLLKTVYNKVTSDTDIIKKLESFVENSIEGVLFKEILLCSTEMDVSILDNLGLNKDAQQMREVVEQIKNSEDVERDFDDLYYTLRLKPIYSFGEIYVQEKPRKSWETQKEWDKRVDETRDRLNIRFYNLAYLEYILQNTNVNIHRTENENCSGTGKVQLVLEKKSDTAISNIPAIQEIVKGSIFVEIGKR